MLTISDVRCAFPWARQVAAQELRALEVQQEHMLVQYHAMGKLGPSATAKDAGGEGRRKADGGKARQAAGEFVTPAGPSSARDNGRGALERQQPHATIPKLGGGHLPT